MFGNYFKTTMRHLLKQRGFTFINIFGLAIGMASCMLILLWIRHELAYDDHHPESERIFRIVISVKSKADLYESATVAAPVARVLEDDYPPVEDVASLLSVPAGLVKYGTESFYEEGRFFVNSGFFSVFRPNFLRGDPEKALDRPNTVVITERIALKYFGGDDPTGQTLKINSGEYEITGVVDDPPTTTHLDYNLMMSLETIRDRYPFEAWGLSNFLVYIKLKDGIDTAVFAGEITNLADNYIGEQLETDGETAVFTMQPIGDIHLHSNLQNEAATPGNSQYILMFGSIGVLIMLIACINFVNLATARRAARGREVAVRKVIGAGRGQLAGQFIGETLLQALIAIVIAFILLELLAVPISGLAGINLSTRGLLSLEGIILVAGLVLFTGLGAGLYPASVFTAMRPAILLRGNGGSEAGGRSLRKILVVGQFAISIILIIGTLTVYRQIEYMKTRDLGFDNKQKLIFPARGSTLISEDYDSIKNEFSAYNTITGATAASNLPGFFGSEHRGLDSWDTWIVDDEQNYRVLDYLYCEPAFLSEYGIDLEVGNLFQREYVEEGSNQYLLNEAAVRTFGFDDPEAIIGKKLTTNHLTGEVVGVVKDFHIRGLQCAIDPLVMVWLPDRFRYFCLSIDTSDPAETISFARETWQRLYPDRPFEFAFHDAVFDRQYNTEERNSSLFALFTGIALFIACLGLYSLAAYTAECRTKEIGIRKVLGASIPGIVRLLSREFIVLVLLANVIAWPVAYLVMDKWLQNFAYRSGIGWSLPLLAGLLALVIATVTLSHHALRAALADPVKALRYE